MAEHHKAMAQKLWGPKGSRFWAKVKKVDGACWLWAGPIDTNTGYGYYKNVIDGEQVETAHRAAYLYAFGSAKGKEVGRTCHNKLCCNPKHLILRTSLERHQDTVRRGKASGGSKNQVGINNNGRKITERQARLVLMLSELGMRQIDISRCLGIRHENVWAIVNRESWTHISIVGFDTSVPAVMAEFARG